jgi:anthranilate synthase component I
MNQISLFLASSIRSELPLSPIDLMRRVDAAEVVLFESASSGSKISTIAFSPLATFKFFIDRTEELVQNRPTVTTPHAVRGLKRRELFASALNEFLMRFKPATTICAKSAKLFGHSTYELAGFCDELKIDKSALKSDTPLAEYTLFSKVIELDSASETATFELFTLHRNGLAGDEHEHFDEETFLLPHILELSSKTASANVSAFSSPMTDLEHEEIVRRSKDFIRLGEVFQLVASRSFSAELKGDPLILFDALSTLNPSPYQYYLRSSTQTIFGCSPESQLVVRDGVATLNPIAGTCHLTGDPAADHASEAALLEDPKELSEHVMLVDLARNDLSRNCEEVVVKKFRQIKRFSHVSHLASEVSGKIPNGVDPVQVFASTFPAGTVTGAPKIRAMELINSLENHARGFYSGAIGFFSLAGEIDHAITIRTFLAKEGRLTCQAGSGVVIGSTPQGEVQEVRAKLRALFQVTEENSTLAV